MSSANRTNCALRESGRIYYDIDSIDLKSDPTKTKSTGFEALFLGDVIDEIENGCFTIQENCKSQYPYITMNNYEDWITSIDQDNRIGLAHVIETSKVPVLYNTPRLCDPGMTISKNWSLKNYIETRLFAFKRHYNQGRTLTNRNLSKSDCYPSIYFDFTPFEYKMEDAWSTKKNKGSIYITEWITVGGDGKDTNALGYTPNLQISNRSRKSSIQKVSDEVYNIKIFKQMVSRIMQTKLGISKSSFIKNAVNIGPNRQNNGTINNKVYEKYLDDFIKFLRQYDGIKFTLPHKSTATTSLRITEIGINVLYFDLIHDGVFNKKQFPIEKFKRSFKDQFYQIAGSRNMAGGPAVNYLVGAKMAQNSHKAYGGEKGNILLNTWAAGNRRNTQGKAIPLVPSIYKTLGDLSQFVYAATNKTVVGSGDKMGMATGLFMSAGINKSLKLMMEDSVTGFILYTGFPKIRFTSRTTCANQTGGVCARNNKTVKNKSEIANRIRSSANRKMAPRLGPKPNLRENRNLFINSGEISRNYFNTFIAKVGKFLDYFNEEEFELIDKILTKMEGKANNGLILSNNRRSPQNQTQRMQVAASFKRTIRALKREIIKKTQNPYNNRNGNRNNGSTKT